MTTARVAARNHHLDHHSTRAKKEKKVSSKIVPLVCVAPRGFAASAFAEAETTRESQLRLGAAKYAIGENNTASLTQGRICLHPRNDHAPPPPPALSSEDALVLLIFPSLSLW